MVKVEVKCPECGDVKISKNGKTETGAQRYICNNKDCQCKSFMLEYIYNGNKHGIEDQIIAMAANASGIRDWLNAVKCVKFLDGLLIKFANYANKVG